MPSAVCFFTAPPQVFYYCHYSIFSVLHWSFLGFFQASRSATTGPFSRQKEPGEGEILTTLLAPYFTLQNQAQASSLSMPQVHKSLCYSLLTHLLVLPSSWPPSHWREISAFPLLFFSSSRYRAVVLPSQYQLVRVLVLQTPLLLSWSLLFASLWNFFCTTAD